MYTVMIRASHRAFIFRKRQTYENALKSIEMLKAQNIKAYFIKEREE